MSKSLSEYVFYEDMEKHKKFSKRLISLFKSEKYILSIIVGILLINIIIVDIILFSSKTSTSPSGAASTSLCTQNCISEIMERVTSYIKITTSSSSESANKVDLASSLSITPTSSPTPTPTDTPTPTPTLTPTNTPTPIPMVKEFFIPLGQGSGSSGDWTTVSGMEVKIDPSNYGKIDKVYFEVTVRIPTGNQTVYVRLYNANTYQSISGSELSHDGGTVKLLTSSPITLASGNNTYQLQLKTQLKYLTYIDQARIRILTK